MYDIIMPYYLLVGFLISLSIPYSILVSESDTEESVLNRKYVYLSDIFIILMLMLLVMFGWGIVLLASILVVIGIIPMFFVDSVPYVKNRIRNKLAIVWKKKKYKVGTILKPKANTTSNFNVTSKIKIVSVKWNHNLSDWYYTCLLINQNRYIHLLEYSLDSYYDALPHGTLTDTLFL